MLDRRAQLCISSHIEGGKGNVYKCKTEGFFFFFDLGDILQILKYYKKRELESFI